jgi:hypothetical protein
MAGNRLFVSGHVVRISPKPVYLKDKLPFYPNIFGANSCACVFTATSLTGRTSLLIPPMPLNLTLQQPANCAIRSNFYGSVEKYLKKYKITIKSFFVIFYVYSVYTVHMYVALICNTVFAVKI